MLIKRDTTEMIYVPYVRGGLNEKKGLLKCEMYDCVVSRPKTPNSIVLVKKVYRIIKEGPSLFKFHLITR